LTFEFENDTYVIKEDSAAIFSINAKELIFNALNFYNGIYRGEKSTQIELKKDIREDLHKRGEYVFNWLNEIISQIANEFDEEETSEEEAVTDADVEIFISPSNVRIIKLYELAACGGSGFFMGNEDIPYKDIEVENPSADFAVIISGCSMEPTLPDGSVLLVKEVQELNDGDIGVFLVDGESMCKRYNKDDDGTVILVPDNDSGEYDSILVDSNMLCIIRGRVLGIHESSMV